MINRRGLTLLAITCAAILLLVVNHAWPRDLTNRYAASPLKPWFDGLRSGNGPCCSDADGTALSDVDWEIRTSTGTPTETNGVHYRVRIEKQWVDVPATAVLDGPNLAGVAMVWPHYQNGELRIRCFIPGVMG